MTEALEQAIADLQAAAAKQGDVVRSLKASAKDGKAEKVGWCSWIPARCGHSAAAREADLGAGSSTSPGSSLLVHAGRQKPTRSFLSPLASST